MGGPAPCQVLRRGRLCTDPGASSKTVARGNPAHALAQLRVARLGQHGEKGGVPRSRWVADIKLESKAPASSNRYDR